MTDPLRRRLREAVDVRKQIWNERQRPSPRKRPWWSLTTWSGALAAMGVLLAVLWVVQFANAADDYGFNRYGLRPRTVDGLWGIVTQPFLHASYEHLLSNSAPFALIGWVLLRSDRRLFAIVTAAVVVVGGAATWLVGPSGAVIVGASGLVFGWLGYLLARAWFARRVVWIIEAVLVLFFFGTLLYGLFPTVHTHVSWQSHVCGFLAGALTGGVLHPRRGTTRRFGRASVS
ncbi:MAG: rhomboid family intramembrane serine protease [Jatrophihabitans sp.]|uniref:rhomboid family intramembrane serine protease n=1 Tax=Jatrophihabitans sp. TaxID=1932789 RepID=UPI003F8122AA